MQIYLTNKKPVKIFEKWITSPPNNIKISPIKLCPVFFLLLAGIIL